MIEVADDRGRVVSLSRPPRRVVSLVPNITETLFALGAGEAVAGVTRFCAAPAEARRRPRLGGTKDPDCARIVAYRPDLVFMSEEENRVEDYRALRDAGLPVFVSFPKRVDEVCDWLERLGRIVGHPREAAQLGAGIRQALDELAAEPAAGPLRVFCPVWRDPWMTFNADTYAHDVLRLSGAANVCADGAQRYGTVSLDAVAARHPELLLLPSEPYRFRQVDLQAMQAELAAWGGVPPARFIDGRALWWFGARTAAALRLVRASVRAAVAAARGPL